MKFRSMLQLQKCLYLNTYLFLLWTVVIVFFLHLKVHLLGNLTKYLSLTVLSLLIVIESARLYFGCYGNLSCRVPELAGFLILTILMQLPLVSFFLFNSYLLNSPTETTLHLCLWILTIAEVVFGFQALKQASFFAKRIYLKKYKDKVSR